MPPQADPFSYTYPGDPPLRRFAIRLIERLTGQPFLRRLYANYLTTKVPGELPWDVALRFLNIALDYDKATLAAWPKTGPLIVVANHPFGVIDGLAICRLVAQVRLDFLVLTNSVLCRIPEITPYVLPIDFSETKDALRTNLDTRVKAKAHLLSGGCLVIFPAGEVATTPGAWRGIAVDGEWKTYAAKLISCARAPVAPVFFEGQNSRLFHLASHINTNLRMALMVREIRRRIGGAVRIHVGEVVPFKTLAAISSRQALMAYLKRITYALNARGAPP